MASSSTRQMSDDLSRLQLRINGISDSLQDIASKNDIDNYAAALLSAGGSRYTIEEHVSALRRAVDGIKEALATASKEFGAAAHVVEAGVRKSAKDGGRIEDHTSLLL